MWPFKRKIYAAFLIYCNPTHVEYVDLPVDENGFPPEFDIEKEILRNGFWGTCNFRSKRQLVKYLEKSSKKSVTTGHEDWWMWHEVDPIIRRLAEEHKLL